MILNTHNSAVTSSPQNNQSFMSRPPRITIQPSNLETIFFSLTGLNNYCTTDYSIQNERENTSNITISRDSTFHNQV